MLYDTIYRHNQALSPDALTTVPAAIHAVAAAIDDCRRAGKQAVHDAAVLILLKHLAEIAIAQPVDVETLRTQCRIDRAAVLATPALLSLAGHDLGGQPSAKRCFHHQARQALGKVAEALDLDASAIRIVTTPGNDHEDGTTELSHADLGIRVVPRGLLPAQEVSFFRCRAGTPIGRAHHAPIRELLEPGAFARRLRAELPARAPALRVAA